MSTETVLHRTSRGPTTAIRRLGAHLAGIAGLALLACAPLPASAQKTWELQFASYVGAAAAQSKASEWWAKEIEQRTGGRVKVKFFYQGSLIQATDILKGVAEGRADLGYIANAYHPAELPLSSVVGVPFVTSNAEAQMRTFTELYERNAAFRGEWQRQGVHVLFFHPLSENIVGMRRPAAAVADLQGKRIRGLGYINQVLQMVGANPVAIAAPEIYESLLRGTLDGYSGFAFEVVTALKLHEVAPHTVAMGTGNYVFAATPITRKTWDAMPEDIRKIITDVSSQYTSKVVEILAQTEDEVCSAIKKAGGTVSVMPDAEIEKIRTAVGDRVNQLWIKDATARGAQAAAFFDDYLATLKKYEAQSKYVSGVKRCASKG
jgi:TRAP-type C4-dicarboxylate transport system substrate-binding protein